MDVMKKVFFVFFVSSVFSVFSVSSVFAQTVHILSVNDIHATIEKMPQLAALVDSLRQEDPELIVLSAGDNRTGNPVNDRHATPGLQMLEMMNKIGFNASALGNHEFDSKIEGLRTIVNEANFKHLCCNIYAPDSMRLHTYPYMFLEAHGVKIGVLGTLAINSLGIPDCHPNNVIGVKFRQPDEVIPEYRWMKDQCDVMILLSHDGYKEDIQTAEKYPWLDMIIGGHSHTKVDGELHNGVLITQAQNKLKYATLITIRGVQGEFQWSSKLIPLDKSLPSGGDLEEAITQMISAYSDNPFLQEVVTEVSSPFLTTEELGNMEMDALLAETGADVAIQNGGGVRFSSFPAGPMTVMDVLKLDPFGNDAVMYEMTGQEIADFIMNDYNIDMHQTVFVGGITYDMQVNSVTGDAESIKIKMPDGSKFDLKKKYRMVTNSYAASISTSKKSDQGKSLFRPCSDFVIDWLRSQSTIFYTGSRRAVINR